MIKSKSAGKKRGLSMANKNAVSGYLFIAPFVLGFIAFMAYPLYQSIRMSFSEVRMDVENFRFSMEFIRLANFNRALRIHPEFIQFVTEEIIRMALLVPAILVFSLFVAILLNRKFVGRGFVRAIFFLPVILASGVLVGIETNNSLLNMVAEQIQEENAIRAGVTSVIEDILITTTGVGAVGDFVWYILDIVNQIYHIAMASGIQILIFLAGLQTINPSIYEAASIEGATGWENFWKITFPMISPMILVVVVYSVIDFMTRTDSEVMLLVEDHVWLMQHGFASAMIWFYFLIIAAILGLLAFFISRLVYYYD